MHYLLYCSRYAGERGLWLEELQTRENVRAEKAKTPPKRIAITAETALRDCFAVLNYIANTLLKPSSPAENGADEEGDPGEPEGGGIFGEDDGGVSEEPGGCGLTGAGEGTGTEPAGGAGREGGGENTAGD